MRRYNAAMSELLRPREKAFATAAVVLFVIGLLVPILTLLAIFVFGQSRFIGWFDTPEPHNADVKAIWTLGIVIGIVCEVLAIVLGMVGRRYAIGKVGMIGGVIVLAWPTLIWLLNLFLSWTHG